jgi:hypothetical protein
MKAVHRLEIECRCPVDDRADLYDAEIHVARVLPVEDILRAASVARTMVVFQEDLTVWLSRELNAKVVTRGCHSGVSTEVSAP